MQIQIPRVVAIHDLSCFGKCSLGIVIPTISAMGAEVCPFPTTILSSYMKYENPVIVDFTDNMGLFLKHFQKISFHTDIVYSGFLGNFGQIELIKQSIDILKPKTVVVDPVMGDNGKLYKIYDDEMCKRMKELVSVADIVTPNLTEAFMLAEERYSEEDTSKEQMQFLAHKIRALGAKTVVITGVERESYLYNCILDEQGYREIKVELLAFRKSGTGDLFASILVGKLLQNCSVDESVSVATNFVYEVLSNQYKYTGLAEDSIFFEPFLYRLQSNQF